MTMNLFQMNNLAHPKNPPIGYAKLGSQRSIHPNGRKSAKFAGTEEYRQLKRERDAQAVKDRNERIQKLKAQRAGAAFSQLKKAA